MNLDVLIPSLFLPDPIASMFPAPAAPALTTLLARADRRTHAHATATAWLCEAWGIGPPYPVASISAAFDGMDTRSDAWLFAEPVNMASQSKHLKLFPARYLDLTADESRQLIETLNAHFLPLELAFFAPAPDRWYVRCTREEMPETVSVDEARLGSMLDFQPKSRGKINWRALQNEIQMLFHGHPVNAARDAGGKPLVDGVWFWGGGEAGALRSPGYDTVHADSPLAIQLARQSGAVVRPLAPPDRAAGTSRMLAVIDSCHDLARDLEIQEWVAEIERLDREWFQPVAQALRGGAIDKLTVFSPDGAQTRTFTITRSQLAFRVWRKPVRLSTHA